MNWLQYVERYDEPFRTMVLEVVLRYELLRWFERRGLVSLLAARAVSRSS